MKRLVLWLHVSKNVLHRFRVWWNDGIVIQERWNTTNKSNLCSFFNFIFMKTRYCLMHFYFVKLLIWTHWYYTSEKTSDSFFREIHQCPLTGKSHIARQFRICPQHSTKKKSHLQNEKTENITSWEVFPLAVKRNKLPASVFRSSNILLSENSVYRILKFPLAEKFHQDSARQVPLISEYE